MYFLKTNFQFKINVSKYVLNATKNKQCINLICYLFNFRSIMYEFNVFIAIFFSFNTFE